MSAFNASSIAENTTEDFIEDGISELVYAMGNCYFNDNKSKKCDSVVKSAFDEALAGAGNTLKFSIMTAVIYRVSEYAMVRIVAGSAEIFAYIKAGRIVNTIKRKVESSFNGVPIVGRFFGSALTVITAIAVGNQKERLAMTGMANNNMNNMTTVISQERQTATIQVTGQRHQLMKTLDLNNNSRGLSDDKRLEAYHFKMKTGTWNKSKEDKKLFISVVPRQYITSGFNYNSAFVEQLNSFTEYAKTTEDKIVNLTTVLAKTLATKGAL